MFKAQLLNKVRYLIYNNGRDNYGRDRYEHTLRVIEYCKAIQKEEGGDLEVILYAALFHDIGWKQNVPHALVSRAIAKKLLRSIKLPKHKKESILKCIAMHSHKNSEAESLSLEQKVLIDADILDELGMLSILFSCSNSCHLNKRLDYKDIYNRISCDLEKYKTKTSQYIKLETTRKIFNKKIEFLTLALEQMKEELFI